ncbi:MAG: efflux RND transporter periplasmic adaptor subunit [Veillonellales bacterium]
MIFKNKKIAIAAAVIFVLTGIIGYRVYANVAASKARAGQMSQGNKVVVQVAQVGRHDIQPNMTFSAGLEPVWSADVSAKVDGRINTLTVTEGDAVKAGAVIATLDTADLSAQVIQGQGNLMAAQSNLEQAEMDYQRYSVLAGQGAISAQMLDNARTKRDLAAGQVKAAEGGLALMEEKLNNARIVVPQDGVVTKRYVQSGTFTRAGSPIVTVADVSTLLAKATIGEAQIGELQVGTTVKVKLDALSGQEFTGIITHISPAAQLPARTFTAEVTISNGSGALKAGMFAKVEIPTRVHQNVLAIPESALVMREDQKTVFVVDADNKIQQRILKLGYVGDGWAEVLEGVIEGDTIVIAGQNKVKDGIEVSPAKEGAS